MRTVATAAALIAILARPSGAAPCSRSVEIRLAPADDLQLAVWIEDASGRFVDTAFVTRSTGMLGLGNRPGNPRFKSDYRFPYGAREMVLPVWAHARGASYGRVVMGGADGTQDNDSIGNHFPVSSPESFYCSPTGGLHRLIDGVDIITCASPFFGSKGLYAPGGSSVYPPRADLVDFTEHDSADAKNFATANDVAVVSGATPPGGRELAPPLRWTAPASLADGDYVVRVEASQEADFNAAHHHPSVHDTLPQYDPFGRDVLGQPSVVWSVGFRLDGGVRVATGDRFAGYGDWDGASGALHPPDGTITEGRDGTGAGRLLERHDGDGAWRIKVATLGCDGACAAPAPPTALALTPDDASIHVAFRAPDGAARPTAYEVRYRVGVPLTDGEFALGTPGDRAPPPGPPGAPQSFDLLGLHPQTTVWVGLRAVAACGKPSAAAVASTSTLAGKFTVLHGCFVATAAYGSPLAGELAPLRAFRDRRLLGNPLGRLAVAAYYAFAPPLAERIAVDERLRAAARALLDPLVRELVSDGTSHARVAPR